MGFKYTLKIFVDEQTARRAVITPEVVRKMRSTGTKMEYSSGILNVITKENHDIDEDLLRALSKAIGKPVEAVAEIEVNGRVKEIFRGKLDPFKPLGVSSTEDVEKEEEEETTEDDDIFVDEEDLEEEIFYYEDDD